MADDSGEPEQWRFDVDEVGADAEPRRESIEPESVDPENAVFVALGIVGTVGLLVTIIL